jgi:hypothetical protein
MDMRLVNASRGGRPARLYVVLTLLSVTAIAAGTLCFWNTRPLRFSSDAWRHKQHLRPRMTKDLLARDDLLGSHRDRINDLLGIPRGRDGAQDDRYVYWAGTTAIDDMWLEIQFHNDRVVDVRCYPD